MLFVVFHGRGNNAVHIYKVGYIFVKLYTSTRNSDSGQTAQIVQYRYITAPKSFQYGSQPKYITKYHPYIYCIRYISR